MDNRLSPEAEKIVEGFKQDEERRRLKQRLNKWKARCPLGPLTGTSIALLGALGAMGHWWPPGFWNLVAVCIFGVATATLLIFFLIRWIIIKKLEHEIKNL